MSIELIVWTESAISVPKDLPENHSWKKQNKYEWIFKKNGWQILLEISPICIPSKAVISVNNRYLNSVYLTIDPETKEAKDFLNLITCKIAKTCRGAILDREKDILVLDNTGNEI